MATGELGSLTGFHSLTAARQLCALPFIIDKVYDKLNSSFTSVGTSRKAVDDINLYKVLSRMRSLVYMISEP